jgi:hypothetical protein
MENNNLGYWNKKKEKLKKRYEFLTDKDLSFNEGKEKEMIEILSHKLGKTKEELIQIIVVI